MVCVEPAIEVSGGALPPAAFPPQPAAAQATSTASSIENALRIKRPYSAVPVFWNETNKSDEPAESDESAKPDEPEMPDEYGEPDTESGFVIRQIKSWNILTKMRTSNQYESVSHAHNKYE
ncbi:MAG: hypothetical protein Q4D81_05270 [Eubacteriales bacterium]|nr:hypothetical protein [Eubacteriales bacterium]